MSQGVTPCTTLLYVSDIGVIAFMWSKFRWRKRKNSSHLKGRILDGKMYKIFRTYEDHRITLSQDHSITVSEDHRISVSEDHRITRSQYHRIAGSEYHSITGSQDHSIRGSQYHRITGS
jgi:hypothetical protein